MKLWTSNRHKIITDYYWDAITSFALQRNVHNEFRVTDGSKVEHRVLINAQFDLGQRHERLGWVEVSVVLPHSKEVFLLGMMKRYHGYRIA